MKSSDGEPKYGIKPIKYQWVASDGECQKCSSLNGRVFDEIPKKDAISHPHCKCKIMEIEWSIGEKLQARHNGKRWEEKWNHSKIGKNKFSRYGKERNPLNPETGKPLYPKPKIHRGDDIALPKNTQIPAVKDGIVVINKFQENGYGNYIRVKNSDNTYSEYGHMVRPSKLHLGAHVKQSDIVGYVGNTGGSTGNHLHYSEYDSNVKYIEPSEDSRQYLFDYYNNLL